MQFTVGDGHDLSTQRGVTQRAKEGELQAPLDGFHATYVNEAQGGGLAVGYGIARLATSDDPQPGSRPPGDGVGLMGSVA